LSRSNTIRRSEGVEEIKVINMLCFGIFGGGDGYYSGTKVENESRALDVM